MRNARIIDLENEKEMGKHMSNLSSHSPVTCCPLSHYFQREGRADAGLKAASVALPVLAALFGETEPNAAGVLSLHLFVHFAALPPATLTPGLRRKVDQITSWSGCTASSPPKFK